MVVAKLDAEGKVSELKDDDELVSCANPNEGCQDVYGLYFEPAREAYIYAFQQDETGDTAVLFPNGAFSDQSNPVAADTRVWVPNDFKEWFYLGGNTGTGPLNETIFVVAVAERIEFLEGLVESVMNPDSNFENAEGQLQEELEKFLVSRGVAGTIPRNDAIRDPEGNLTDLGPLILDSAGEVGFFYRVDFKNLPPP